MSGRGFHLIGNVTLHHATPMFGVEPDVEPENDVHRHTVRTVLTILMYAGVGLFLLPYLTGKASTAPLLMVLGAMISVVCGLLRCYLTEGE